MLNKHGTSAMHTDANTAALNTYEIQQAEAFIWFSKYDPAIKERALDIAVQKANNEDLVDVIRDNLTDEMLARLIEMTLHDGPKAKVGVDIANMIQKECIDLFEDEAEEQIKQESDGHDW